MELSELSDIEHRAHELTAAMEEVAAAGAYHTVLLMLSDYDDRFARLLVVSQVPLPLPLACCGGWG